MPKRFMEIDANAPIAFDSTPLAERVLEVGKHAAQVFGRGVRCYVRAVTTDQRPRGEDGETETSTW